MIFNLSALILFFFKILKNPGGGTRYPTNQISSAYTSEVIPTIMKILVIGIPPSRIIIGNNSD